MKLDYDVLRGVMLKIEEEYVDVALYNLKVNDYDLKTIAYHCKILYEGGYVDNYGGQLWRRRTDWIWCRFSYFRRSSIFG